MNFLLGTVILYHSMTAWTSKIQQWWWKVMGEKVWQLSHASIYVGINRHLDRMMEYEANLQVDHTTFNYNEKNMILFYPYCHSDSVKRALNKTINESEETVYGFIGWFAIALRGIFEMILPKTYKTRVKGWNILWGWGIFCSELVWRFWDNLCEDIAENSYNIQEKRYWTAFHYQLEKYNPNTFTPVDVYKLQVEYDWCFRKYKKGD